MPAASVPPKRRVLGGISTTTGSSSPSASGSGSGSGYSAHSVAGPSSSSSSSTSPNPVRVLRPTSVYGVGGVVGGGSGAHVRPPSAQGRPLSTSTLSPASAASSSSSSPRIRAKVDLSNIVSSSPSPASSSSPLGSGAGPSSSGRTSPFKQLHPQQQQAALRRTGSTTSVHSTTAALPRIHLSSSAGPSHAGSSTHTSSPSGTRSNSIIGGIGALHAGPPSPNVTLRAKHRNQSVDLGASGIVATSSPGGARVLPSSLAPSPQRHRRISSSSATPASMSPLPSLAYKEVAQPSNANAISPPSSSVSSSASSSRRVHVVNGNASGIKVQAPALAESHKQGQPPPSISLVSAQNGPLLAYSQQLAHDLSPTTMSPLSPNSTTMANMDPFLQLQLQRGSVSGPASTSTTPTSAGLSSVSEFMLTQNHPSLQAESEARVAAAVAALDAKKERKMADLEISNKSLLAINANLEKERLKMSKEMRELRRKATIASAAAAAAGASGSSGIGFGSGIGGFIALLRGGRKHSADGSVPGTGTEASENGHAVGASGEARSPGVGPENEDDEQYWLQAALAELTDEEDDLDGPSDEEDDDSDEEDDALDATADGGGPDERDDVDGVGTRRQRARQRALAERKVASLVRDWQKLDAAHTRCRSLVEDMLLRGRLACKLSLDADQAEIVEEVRREEEAAQAERRKLLEMEYEGRKGTRVLHPLEMEERREAERREREEAVAKKAALGATADGGEASLSQSDDVSTESKSDSASSTDNSIAASDSSSSASHLHASPPSPSPSPSKLVPPGRHPVGQRDGEQDVNLHQHRDEMGDNSDARSDVSSRTERGGDVSTDASTDVSASASASTHEDDDAVLRSAPGDISLD